MHPKILALGAQWREGQRDLRLGTASLMGAMAPLRQEIRVLCERTQLEQPLAKARTRYGRLELSDFQPVRGEEPPHFFRIAAATCPARINRADWACLFALSIAADPRRVVQFVARARMQFFDRLEASIPTLPILPDEAGEGEYLALIRPVR